MQKSMNAEIASWGRYTPNKPRRLQDGWNISDILRDICFDLMDAAGIRYGEFARRLEYSESSLHRFLYGYVENGVERDSDLRLEFLSRLCAYTGEAPAELFARHWAFRSDGQAPQSIFVEFTSVLLAPEARALLPLIQSAKLRGVLDLCLKNIEGIVEAAKRSDQTGKRARRAG